MRIRAFLILFVFVSTIVHSQNISFDLGGNYGSFYDFRRDEGHFRTDYSPGFGISCGFRVSELRIDSLFNLQFFLGFEQYEGDFYATDGGLGGGISENGFLKKQIIDFEFYPLNIDLVPNLKLSLGMEVNFRVNQFVNGTRNQWQISEPISPNVQLSSIDGFVRPFNCGINAAFGYEFQVGQFIFKPYYKYFIGITQEFDYIQSYARAHRHALLLGIGYSLK